MLKSSAVNEVARHRSAAFLADQRNVAFNTPLDSGRTAAPGVSAVPEPTTLSRPIGQHNPTSTKPDLGTVGAAMGGGDAQQTEAEKAQWAQTQQEDTMRQQVRKKARCVMAEEAHRYHSEHGNSTKVKARMGNRQQGRPQNGNDQKAGGCGGNHGGKNTKGGGGQQQQLTTQQQQ
ncbi:hypothetical protein SARC_13857 [Sphaeroforma arctica JP610]|uniref:Uncharacterized protein n=1 Tax=Sphaeroforma arctica JP610 TaxID=667725 RepID=A0A0L0FA54_9EUKA|nr:hypothetical protein SARC_13857 [Sphaeroforma arctica JP610]KNC73582.1 hypothetical protein SARC_13857 [Sphaeroforma arctica JP610]|eukprot:XP_014147484.1 hypothetical protein SARC_13857 [Sphaeroforma arctica JP610]